MSTCKFTRQTYSQADKARNLINNEKFSDICFLVGDSSECQKKIYGHKLILAMGSPVFEKMFYGDLAEKRSLIQIPDLTPTGFMNMIRYIYGEKIRIPIHELYETFMAGDKYMVYNLCDLIRGYLKENLNEENKILVYDQLMKIKVYDPLVNDKLLDDMRRSVAKRAFSNKFFNQISEHTLIDLLSVKFLDINEIDILKSCLDWINATNSTIEDKRSSFRRIVPYINLFGITIENLKELEEIDTFMTKEEIADLFLFLSNPRKRKYPFKTETPRKRPLNVNCMKATSLLYRYSFFFTPLIVSCNISLVSIQTSLPSYLQHFEFCLFLEESRELRPNVSKVFRHNRIVLSFPDYFKINAGQKYVLRFYFKDHVFDNRCLSLNTKPVLDNGIENVFFEFLDSPHCIEKINFFIEDS